MNQGMEFEDSFIRTASEDFYSSLYTVDFSEPKTVTAMGEWVKENTGGLIAPEIKLEPSVACYIMNTIFFMMSGRTDLTRAGRGRVAYGAGGTLAEDRAEMILNRPFLYAVMSREDIPLFIGVYRGGRE